MKKTSHEKFAWVVVLTASLFFFYQFIQMNLFNAINEDLRNAFQLDADQLGQFFSMYFYANFLLLLPAGNLLDRYPTRRLFLFAIAITVIGTFLFALSQHYFFAALGRFMVGGGAAFCFLSCIRIASRWFPSQKMAFVTGVIITMAMCGGLVAQTPFVLLSHFLGWREALFANACLGVVIFILTYFFVQDTPPDMIHEEESDQTHLKKLGLWRSIKLAMLNPQNWFGGIYTALINLPVFVLGGLWGIIYLKHVHNITASEASYATTLFFVGVIVGSLLYGYISDRIGRRVAPMIVGAILSLITISILIWVPGLSLFSLIFLFFLIGLVTSSQVLSYPLVAELNPNYLTSTATSIDSLCIMASGFIVPPLFGWIMENYGVRKMVNGEIFYTAENFNYALLIMPISFIIALIICFFMRETYCNSQT